MIADHFRSCRLIGDVSISNQAASTTRPTGKYYGVSSLFFLACQGFSCYSVFTQMRPKLTILSESLQCFAGCRGFIPPVTYGQYYQPNGLRNDSQDNGVRDRALSDSRVLFDFLCSSAPFISMVHQANASRNVCTVGNKNSGRGRDRMRVASFLGADWQRYLQMHSQSLLTSRDNHDKTKEFA